MNRGNVTTKLPPGRPSKNLTNWLARPSALASTVTCPALCGFGMYEKVAFRASSAAFLITSAGICLPSAMILYMSRPTARNCLSTLAVNAARLNKASCATLKVLAIRDTADSWALPVSCKAENSCCLMRGLSAKIFSVTSAVMPAFVR